jgi:type VI secretion system protein ImpM
VTGFYGKVSTHGDFVNRRLPPAIIGQWDDWLQRCLQASRQQLGNQWLTHYLSSPLWRFALAPGVLGEEGWGGVMMPSVDRVGRHFPLLLAAAGAPPLLDWYHLHADWYDALDALARSSLDPAFTLAAFEAAPLPLLMTAARPEAQQCLPLADDMHAAVASAALQGHSLWWSEGSPSVQPSMLVCRGLPAPESFTAMLDGRWSVAGWGAAPG